MKKKIITALLNAVFIFSSKITAENNPVHAPIPYVDFDISMQREKYDTLLQGSKLILYNFFKRCYELSYPLVAIPMEKAIIPNKIHFIWLGSPLPTQYIPIIQSWIDYNPECTVKIWTDADAETFNFENKDMFNQETNYGAKSDILRVAILEREGGIYADIDQECLKSMKSIRHSVHFAIGIQPLDTNSVQLGIGLIASVPQHPFLHYLIKKLKYNKDIQQIIVKTGPIFFTKCFIEFFGKSGLQDIALPASYFYPCGYTERGQPSEVWHKDEAYAVLK